MNLREKNRRLEADGEKEILEIRSSPFIPSQVREGPLNFPASSSNFAWANEFLRLFNF